MISDKVTPKTVLYMFDLAKTITGEGPPLQQTHTSTVAFNLTLDAADRLAAPRAPGERRKVFVIPPEVRPLTEILNAADQWGQKHLQTLSCKEMLILFIVHTLYQSMIRSSICRVAVTVGNFLFNLQLTEISSIVDSHDNIRRDKATLLESIRDNFASIIEFEGKDIRKTNTTSNESNFIVRLLTHLRPQVDPIPAPPYLPQWQTLSIWQRIRLLIDPELGWIVRLGVEFDPVWRSKLETIVRPVFRCKMSSNDNDNDNARFNSWQLSSEVVEQILNTIKHNQARRKQYGTHNFQVRVYGKTILSFNPEEGTHWHALYPPYAASAEVFGEDEEGEILLGVFHLPLLEEPELHQEERLALRLKSGQVINLTVASTHGEVDTTKKNLMTVTCRNSLLRRSLSILSYYLRTEKGKPKSSKIEISDPNFHIKSPRTISSWLMQYGLTALLLLLTLSLGAAALVSRRKANILFSENKRLNTKVTAFKTKIGEIIEKEGDSSTVEEPPIDQSGFDDIDQSGFDDSDRNLIRSLRKVLREKNKRIKESKQASGQPNVEVKIVTVPNQAAHTFQPIDARDKTYRTIGGFMLPVLDQALQFPLRLNNHESVLSAYFRQYVLNGTQKEYISPEIPCRFNPGDSSVLFVDRGKITRPGFYELHASISGNSNPFIINIYFGPPQTHN